MRAAWFLLFLTMPSLAGDLRVLVAGTGCRTRQLAVERVFEKIPGVREVTILPRAAAPADNQRYFIIRCAGQPPARGQLIEALGRRARHYQVISIVPDGSQAPPGRGA